MYRAVDRATTNRPTPQPLWLPAGWLAVVLLLSAAAPSFGGDGWRARGTKPSQTPPTSVQRSDRFVWGTKQPRSNAKPRAAVRQVAYEDDIAGPALRTAGRIHHDRFVDGEYRVAQQDAGNAFGDSLRDSFEQPFGVDDNRPSADTYNRDADRADQLFDDMPADEPSYDSQPTEPTADSLFDEEPAPTAESIQPREYEYDDELADDLAAPFTDSAPTRTLTNRDEHMKDCSEELAALKASKLDSIDLHIGVKGDEGDDYPFNCSLDDGSVFTPRSWCEITYMWKASGLCHKPLYFEDVQLERYGHSWGPIVQPIISGAHFFGTLPVLPYKMGLKTPNECVYTLGYYRPGDCAPYLIDPIPFTWRAALFEAGGVVGAAAVLP
ncbi:hypothetical protein MalM25_31590 [Planctomycetes bacterium MalM25]|nr:hypothetical protein MalM25_31590 [Planctomycetes bacterium MalM25]